MVFLGHRINADSATKSHVALHVPRANLPRFAFKVFAKTQPYQRDQTFIIMLPTKHKIRPKCSPSVLCCELPIAHFPSSYLLHFPKFYFAANLSFPEERAGTAQEPSEQQTFLTPPPLYNKCSAPYCPPHSSLLLTVLHVTIAPVLTP